MHHLAAVRHQRFAHDLVVAIECELAVLRSGSFRNVAMFLAYIWLAWYGMVDGRFSGPMMRDAVLIDGLAGARQLAVAAALGRDIDDHRAGRHARHHLAR